MKNRFIAVVLTAMTMGVASTVFAAGMDKMQNMAGMEKSADALVSHGTGVVKDIDTKQNTIILAHQPIKELNWSAMTMAFSVSDAKLLKGVKVGDQVSFELKGSGMAPVVTAIRAIK